MKFVEAKLVTIGQWGVGKSSIVKRYIDKAFEPAYRQTIGACFQWCKFNIGDINLTLHIWDTAGEERFKALMPMYCRTANAVFLTFDLTSSESFKSLKNSLVDFKKYCDENVVLILIGNKLDLIEKRQVSEKEARNFASLIGASYYEVSALTSYWIDDIFDKAASELINLVNQKKETTMKFYECKSLVDNNRKKVLKLLTDTKVDKQSKNCPC